MKVKIPSSSILVLKKIIAAKERKPAFHKRCTVKRLPPSPATISCSVGAPTTRCTMPEQAPAHRRLVSKPEAINPHIQVYANI